MRRKASCCCGVSSIEVEGEPVLNAVCHCRNCKARTGSAFGWSAYFADERVLATAGDLRLYATDGGKAQRRWFCGTCGTTLFWKADFLMPAHTGVAGGCFQGADMLDTPSLSNSDDGRCAWVTLPKAWRVLP